VILFVSVHVKRQDWLMDGSVSLHQVFLVRVGGCPVPRAAFFAMEDIPAGSELTFSYGASSPSHVGRSSDSRHASSGSEQDRRECTCGASTCKGFLPSEL
jgi:SET domain-containing protein